MIFYWLFSMIAQVVFTISSKILVLIDDLSKYNFFSQGTINDFTSKVYVIIGVLMLFKLVISAVQYIVNPDMFDDKSKGLGAVLKKSIIVVILLAIVPSIFTFAMEIQGDVVEQIPKVIFGNRNYSVSEASENISMTIMSSFLNAKEGRTTSKVLDSVADFSAVATDGCGSISLLPSSWINAITGEWCNYDLMVLLSPIAGVFFAYILISLTIDVATRTIKLGIVQILAPIPITEYITDEKKMTNWAKTSVQIYVDLFIRLAVIYLIIYIIQVVMKDAFGSSGYEALRQGVSGATGRNPDALELGLIKIVIIGALLLFAKNAPKFITELLGLKGAGEGFNDMFKRAGGLFGATVSTPGRFAATRKNEMNRLAQKYGDGKSYNEMTRRERREMLKRAAADGQNPRTHSIANALRAAGSGFTHGVYDSVTHNKGYSDTTKTVRNAADRSYAISKAIDDKGVSRSQYRHAVHEQRRGIESSYSFGNQEIEASRSISDSAKKTLDWGHTNLIAKNGGAQLTTDYISQIYGLSDSKYSKALSEAMNFEIKDANGNIRFKVGINDLNVDAGGKLTLGDVQKTLTDIVNDISGRYDSIAKRQAETQLDLFNGEVDKFLVGEESKRDHGVNTKSGVKHNPLFANLFQETDDKVSTYSTSSFSKDMIQKGIRAGVIDPATNKPFVGLEGIWFNMIKSGGLEAETAAKAGMGTQEMAAKSAEDIAKQFDNKK